MNEIGRKGDGHAVVRRLLAHEDNRQECSAHWPNERAHTPSLKSNKWDLGEEFGFRLWVRMELG